MRRLLGILTGRLTIALVAVSAGSMLAPQVVDAAYETDANTPPTRWYRDYDEDGLGDWYDFMYAVEKPAGFVANRDDCWDGPPPGIQARPAIDNDCDGVADTGQFQRFQYLIDADRDGYPAPPPEGHIENAAWMTLAEWQAEANARNVQLRAAWMTTPFDCDDTNGSIGFEAKAFGWTYCRYGARPLGHPWGSAGDVDGANNPNYPDSDGDGHRWRGYGGDDCHDGDSRRYPGAAEVWDVGGHDEDCDPNTGAPIVREDEPWDPRYVGPHSHAWPTGGARGRQWNPYVASPDTITPQR